MQKGKTYWRKAGVETGTDLKKDHYSLTGNQFEIRKDVIDGLIVKVITSDSKGHAETPDAQEQALELGTYFVVES